MAYTYNITTRSGKGSALTHTELDNNFLAVEERGQAAANAETYKNQAGASANASAESAIASEGFKNEAQQIVSTISVLPTTIYDRELGIELL